MKIVANPESKREEKRRAAREARRRDFKAEADPLAFKVLRGEAPKQEWLDVVATIRARHPYPGGE